MAYEVGALTGVAEVAVASIVRVVSRALAGAWRFLPSLMAIAAIGVLIALIAGSPQTAEAACTFAPANSTTDDCSGANTTGVIAAASTNVTLNLLTGGSIEPLSGPSIWLGADADIRLQGGTTTGNAAIANNYAILMGDSSIVTLDGTILSQGGITGPTQGGGSTGFSNALITINSTGLITTSGSANNRGLDGRAGGNTYQIDGTIHATGTSGEGIAVGDNDNVTIGATGRVTTDAGDTARAINGSSATGVKVTMDAGSIVTVNGLGQVGAIHLGDNAHVEVAGTINSTGAAIVGNGVIMEGVAVGANSYVWLKQGGQILTGSNLPGGSLAAGGTGIDTYTTTGVSNSTIVVDGSIDTQLGSGISAHTGDNITVGATGTITVHGGPSYVHAISAGPHTSTGNDQLTIDIAGRVENLGSGSGIFITGSPGGGPVTPLHAHVTIEEGGVLSAQSALVYKQDDGCCGYPEIIDDLVIKGTVTRGTAGTAIDLNDGADTITLFPTYSITGGIDGGTDAGGNPETDTFALDGAANTSGIFNFDTNTVTNFEAGVKKGSGTWTLDGTAGSGINGTFDVQAGKLSVNGMMTSTDFAVETGATLGGGGTIKSFTTSGNIAPGNSIGTLYAGTAAFDAGSIYEVEINPTKSDLVDATGAITIDSSAKVKVLPAAGDYTGAGPYQILVAGAPITDTFAGIIDNSAFLDFALDYGTANRSLARRHDGRRFRLGRRHAEPEGGRGGRAGARPRQRRLRRGRVARCADRPRRLRPAFRRDSRQHERRAARPVALHARGDAQPAR